MLSALAHAVSPGDSSAAWLMSHQSTATTAAEAPCTLACCWLTVRWREGAHLNSHESCGLGKASSGPADASSRGSSNQGVPGERTDEHGASACMNMWYVCTLGWFVYSKAPPACPSANRVASALSKRASSLYKEPECPRSLTT